MRNCSNTSNDEESLRSLTAPRLAPVCTWKQMIWQSYDDGKCFDTLKLLCHADSTSMCSSSQCLQYKRASAIMQNSETALMSKSVPTRMSVNTDVLVTAVKPVQERLSWLRQQ
jgi:hypothetical protein